MIIQQIELKNFRNFDFQKINFTNKTTIIFGRNGVGKTSIIEALYLLINNKSYRTNNLLEVIKKKEKKAVIKSEVKYNNYVQKIKIEIDDEKRLKNDNMAVTKEATSLIFEPGDLELIKGDPSCRRNYLNTQLSKISQNYRQNIKEYEKILKKRNDMLKKTQYQDHKNETLLNVLDEQLVEKGTKIIQFRKQYLDNVNANISKIYYDLSDLSPLNIVYIPSPKCPKYELAAIEKKFRDELVNLREEEMAKGITLTGPQRDDFLFLVNDDLKKFGSQGQQRLAVIAFKLAEIPVFYKVRNTYPLLLLDDLFSELDKKRKNKLLKYISDEIQTIITTPNIEDIDEKLVKRAKIINLDEVNYE